MEKVKETVSFMKNMTKINEHMSSETVSVHS